MTEDHSQFDVLVDQLNALLVRQGDKPVSGSKPDELGDIATTIGVPPPPELIAWLQRCRGAELVLGDLLGTDRRRYLSIAQVIEDAKAFWTRRDWIPIARDKFGNLYCLLCGPEAPSMRPVGFVDISSHDTVEYVVASGLAKFIDAYITASDRDDEDWLTRKKRLKKDDPDIEKFAGIFPLPWEVL